LSDVWSALGGELKPSLDLVVYAPFDIQRNLDIGPPVMSGAKVTLSSPEAVESRFGATPPDPNQAEGTVTESPGAPAGKSGLRLRQTRPPGRKQ
jgi:hypothetical protein